MPAEHHPTRRGRPPVEQWWTINGATMMDALRRAHRGDDPDMVYLELLANSTIEDDGDGGTSGTD